MSATALIIDDEPDIRELVAMTLARMGLDFHTAANLEEARQLLATYEFDVCLTDMRLPDGNGVEFLLYIQEHQPSLPVAVITAHGNMEAAVEAMKNGAYDFVSKPVNLQLLRGLVSRAIALNAEGGDNHKAANEPFNTDLSIRKSKSTTNDSGPDSLQHLSGKVEIPNGKKTIRPISSERLIGQSAPMQALRLMIAKVARTNAPVWITGESGTGKELIARLIHENSPRAKHPFVAINCGAIPSELMESELFGHKKGSFTGATTDKDGLFTHANGGTLFLDEIAELPLHMQVKLLRTIQERKVRPVGGSDELDIDARILSASHKDLAHEVEFGCFRHDLYYRLNVISIESPSLRERTDDIPDLCDFILSQQRLTDSVKEHISISNSAIAFLQAYSFPGNVRELENILERAMALSENNVIDVDDLNLPAGKKASTGENTTTSTSSNAVNPTSNSTSTTKTDSGDKTVDQIDNGQYLVDDTSTQRSSHLDNMSVTGSSSLLAGNNRQSHNKQSPYLLLKSLDKYNNEKSDSNTENHRNIDSIGDKEKQRIVDTLNESRWNRKAAAEKLGLTYRQLRYRIKQLGIDDSKR